MFLPELTISDIIWWLADHLVCYTHAASISYQDEIIPVHDSAEYSVIEALSIQSNTTIDQKESEIKKQTYHQIKPIYSPPIFLLLTLSMFSLTIPAYFAKSNYAFFYLFFHFCFVLSSYFHPFCIISIFLFCLCNSSLKPFLHSSFLFYIVIHSVSAISCLNFLHDLVFWTCTSGIYFLLFFYWNIFTHAHVTFFFSLFFNSNRH